MKGIIVIVLLFCIPLAIAIKDYFLNRTPFKWRLLIAFIVAIIGAIILNKMFPELGETIIVIFKAIIEAIKAM